MTQGGLQIPHRGKSFTGCGGCSMGRTIANAFQECAVSAVRLNARANLSRRATRTRPEIRTRYRTRPSAADRERHRCLRRCAATVPDLAFPQVPRTAQCRLAMVLCLWCSCLLSSFCSNLADEFTPHASGPRRFTAATWNSRLPGMRLPGRRKEGPQGASVNVPEFQRNLHMSVVAITVCSVASIQSNQPPESLANA